MTAFPFIPVPSTGLVQLSFVLAVIQSNSIIKCLKSKIKNNEYK